ncbi:arginyl-tRNA synthetase [Methanosalsum zhilinae DSM 4017]|uniref:Arginine--tRNA ligase n=1 Tax=Methanosalsum zhilinae (strain DSM 4017 / NBRC 107636 / OCM 62 / WeN5) TaxID=679901 RepID=F7XMG4_METZD|nr:arginine--tRNA ligase [Methanosalsum zhilinae]AEH59887.1 arginyl-tRNA synthetase [Methanosalsum zhilinae DSM 4017]
MFLEFRTEVKSVIEKSLDKCGFRAENLDLSPSQHADISSRVAFRLASAERKNPKEIAEKIVEMCEIPENSYIDRIISTGPYINIFAKHRYLEDTLVRIRQDQGRFGGGFCQGRIILEHTSANPNGPLHVGHIRNSVIGDTLYRILKHAGYDVETHYYVNDMGRQIAIVSWALANFDLDGSKKSDHAIADVYIRANAELEKDPDKKIEIDRLMQLVESGDVDTINRFDRAVDHAIEGIRETLSVMNIYHDQYVRESDFVRSGAVSDIIEQLKLQGRTKLNDGALVVDLEDHGFEKNLVIQRSDGTSLYTTRDLAYHEWKARQADRVIDVLGADHKLISSQLKTVLSIIGKPEPEIIIFEFVSLPEGSMSTRRGKFITADDLLEQVERQAFSEVDRRRPEMGEGFKKEVSRMVGMAAVRYDIVKVSPEKSTVFDWKQALDFEKQGGPYIQYSHARACSILRKAEEEGIWNAGNAFDGSVLVEDTEIELIRKMAGLDHAVETASQELKPNIIAIYARELADAFNQFYRFVPVLSSEDEQLCKSRLALVDCSRIVLSEILDILGLEAPDSM